ncbi:MAG: holo-ACP synthase [Verrucomicrobiota bacterium]
MSIYGIGVDVVETERVERAITRYEDRFEQRVFTEGESSYCRSFKGKACWNAFAARFAAKEAISKALGTGVGPDFNWIDLEIIKEESGKPLAVLHDGAADLAKKLGVSNVLISLSHSEHYAVAQAVAVSD